MTVPPLVVKIPLVPHSGVSADADAATSEVIPAVVTAVSPPIRAAVATAARKPLLAPIIGSFPQT